MQLSYNSTCVKKQKMVLDIWDTTVVLNLLKHTPSMGCPGNTHTKRRVNDYHPLSQDFNYKSELN